MSLSKHIIALPDCNSSISSSILGTHTQYLKQFLISVWKNILSEHLIMWISRRKLDLNSYYARFLFDSDPYRNAPADRSLGTEGSNKWRAVTYCLFVKRLGKGWEKEPLYDLNGVFWLIHAKTSHQVHLVSKLWSDDLHIQYLL